jgi:hypothetical protein
MKHQHAPISLRTRSVHTEWKTRIIPTQITSLIYISFDQVEQMVHSCRNDSARRSRHCLEGRARLDVMGSTAREHEQRRTHAAGVCPARSQRWAVRGATRQGPHQRTKRTWQWQLVNRGDSFDLCHSSIPFLFSSCP